MSLLIFAGREQEEIARRAVLLSSSVRSVGLSLMRTINAVGLVSTGQAVAPYVVVDSERSRLTPNSLTPISDVNDDGEIQNALASALGERPEWFRSILVEAKSPPTPLASVGDEITQTGTGTAGFAVRWPGGKGYLTAGHVARSGNGPVRFVHGSSQGKVIAAIEPVVGNSATSADVAVVEDANLSTPTWQRTVSRRPGCLDYVNVRLATGTLNDRVRAYSDFYYTSAAGTYGQVFHTMGGQTIGGHSGAAVITTSDEPVGTVVAGTPGVVTLVQAVDYQLACSSLSGLVLA